MEKDRKETGNRHVNDPKVKTMSQFLKNMDYSSDDTTCTSSSFVPTPKPLSQLRESLHTILNMMDVRGQSNAGPKTVAAKEDSSTCTSKVYITMDPQSQDPPSISSGREVTKSDCEIKADHCRRYNSRGEGGNDSPQEDNQNVKNVLIQNVNTSCERTANQQSCTHYVEIESDEGLRSSTMACYGSEGHTTTYMPVLPCDCITMSSTTSSGNTSESSEPNIITKTIIVPSDPLYHAHRQNHNKEKFSSPPVEVYDSESSCQLESAHNCKESEQHCKTLASQDESQKTQKTCNYMQEHQQHMCEFYNSKDTCRQEEPCKCKISHQSNTNQKESHYLCKCKLEHSLKHSHVCSQEMKQNHCRCKCSSSTEHYCNSHEIPEQQQFEQKSSHVSDCPCARPKELKQHDQQLNESMEPVQDSSEEVEQCCSCNSSEQPEVQLLCECPCHFCPCQQFAENGNYICPVELPISSHTCYPNIEEYPFMNQQPSKSRWKCFCDSVMNSQKKMNRYMFKLKSGSRKKLSKGFILNLVNGMVSDKHVKGRKCNKDQKSHRMKYYQKLSTQKRLLDPMTAQERVDVYYFDHGNSAYYRTTDHQPTARTDMCIEQTNYYVTAFWANIFGTLNIGFAFIVAFILQLFRFLLYSIFRPLTVGVIQLGSDYLFKPLLTILFNGVIQPILILFYNMATSMRDLCEPIATSIGYFLHEIAHLMGSVRLVDVKNTTSVQKCSPGCTSGVPTLEGKVCPGLDKTSKTPKSFSGYMDMSSKTRKSCLDCLDTASKVQKSYSCCLDTAKKSCLDCIDTTSKAHMSCLDCLDNVNKDDKACLCDLANTSKA